ncbi:hypothetical protein ONR75_18480 [Rhodopseudomonas sp. P2A-2r]|uniref:hypothetical protein n=1 Tax=Rhodopseudomonas sp. P2A-2r TaxID=2991972 RepID=UPI00223413A5|nr:hypothetical protein [Rhodopseudomonas sp. P2A-2r]UZE46992.1 hypothetical protein ONR75_18480 [Rhodopseudomonas sp. P2A-2r]
MLKRNTVFVVGAGASKEFDLPVGSELALSISDKLNVKFDDWGQKIIAGDRPLFENLSRSNRGNNLTYQKAAWLIRDGIVLAHSIDDFLDVHKDNATVVQYGKAAIAKCILEAEASSKLYFKANSNARETVNFAGASTTWLVKLMRLLGRQLPHSQRAEIFNRCSFVVFNYDRCIEHFFTNALTRMYDIRPEEAEEIVSKAKIEHVYGSPGTLGSATVGNLVTPFGADRADYAGIGLASIKTYTESVESDRVRSMVVDSEAVVFLGFAFHDQNMKLLAADGSLKPKAFLGTGFGISESDREIVQQQIVDWVEPPRRLDASLKVDIRPALKAADIFDFYSKTL